MTADKRKIIIMSKLAVYEKNDAIKDLKRYGYFRHDYVYRKNMVNRFFVLIGAVIIILLSVLYKIAFKGLDLSNLNLAAEIRSAVIIIVSLLVLFTLIGTVKYNLEYEAVSKRIGRYRSLIGLLDKKPKETEARPEKKYETRRLYETRRTRK